METMEKTYHLGNDIIITVTTGSGKAPMLDENSDAAVNALASPTARHTFILLDGMGSRCSANIWNDSEDTDMDVSFTVTIDGKSETQSDRVLPQRNTIFTITNNAGKPLVGKAITSIKAVNASSVRYTYTIRQF